MAVQLILHVEPYIKEWLKTEAKRCSTTIKNITTEAILKFIGDENLPESVNRVRDFFCHKCKSEWTSVKDAPKVCPYCKSYAWNVPPKEDVEHECNSCGFTWTNTIKSPVACPSCKSRAWDPTSPAYVAERFTVMFEEWMNAVRGRSTVWIAPYLGMTHTQVSRCVMGREMATVEQFRLMEKIYKGEIEVPDQF